MIIINNNFIIGNSVEYKILRDEKYADNGHGGVLYFSASTLITFYTYIICT